MRNIYRGIRCLLVCGCLVSVACVRNTFAWSEKDYSKHDYRSFEKLSAPRQRIPMDNIDHQLLNAAIFYETNRQRILHGLSTLRYSPLLERAAAGHCRDMVRHEFFLHESPVKGRETLRDRVEQLGFDMRNRIIGENIGDVFGIEYESGTTVYPPDEKKDYFSYEPGGKPIPRHTYRGLAKIAVSSWMGSPKHRANILDKRFTALGAGSAHYKDAGFNDIDRFKLTQNFSGELR